MGTVTGATFEDIGVRVAEALGLASATNPDDTTDNRSRLPGDRGRLDKVKRAIVDGMKMLVRDGPRPNGWACLRVWEDITITADGSGANHIDNEPSRIRLPLGVCTGPTRGSLVFKLDDSNISWKAIQTIPDLVVKALGNDESTDYPRAFCVMPFPSQNPEDQGGWEMRIFPRPNGDMTASGTFRRSVPDTITRFSDRHPFGSLNDDLVFIAAIYSRLRVDGKASPEDRKFWKGEYEGALATSIANDSSNEPRSHGIGHDPSVCEGIESTTINPQVDVQIEGVAQ